MPTPDSLSGFTGTMLPAIDDGLRRALRFGERGDFYGMIHYAMGWVDEDLRPVTAAGGKRLRPLLCLLSCQAAGTDWHAALPAAAGLELLHNFSLVHDDIEDRSPLRRGRPTNWHLWGEARAINTGDAMLSLAYRSLTDLAGLGVEPGHCALVLRRFCDAAIELTRGQHRDMDFERHDTVTEDDYLDMIAGKTGALIEASCEIGALVGGAAPAAAAGLAGFGRSLGLAFQVQDDILGIWGDEARTGKSTATDIITRKKTLPVLHGLAASPALRVLYAAPPDGPAFVAEALRLLEEAGSRDYAAAMARRAAEAAHEHLADLPASGDAAAALAALQGLAGALVDRDA